MSALGRPSFRQAAFTSKAARPKVKAAPCSRQAWAQPFAGPFRQGVVRAPYAVLQPAASRRSSRTLVRATAGFNTHAPQEREQCAVPEDLRAEQRWWHGAYKVAAFFPLVLGACLLPARSASAALAGLPATAAVTAVTISEGPVLSAVDLSDSPITAAALQHHSGPFAWLGRGAPAPPPRPANPVKDALASPGVRVAVALTGVVLMLYCLQSLNSQREMGEDSDDEQEITGESWSVVNKDAAELPNMQRTERLLGRAPVASAVGRASSTLDMDRPGREVSAPKPAQRASWLPGRRTPAAKPVLPPASPPQPLPTTDAKALLPSPATASTPAAAEGQGPKSTRLPVSPGPAAAEGQGLKSTRLPVSPGPAAAEGQGLQSTRLAVSPGPAAAEGQGLEPPANQGFNFFNWGRGGTPQQQPDTAQAQVLAIGQVAEKRDPALARISNTMRSQTTTGVAQETVSDFAKRKGPMMPVLFAVGIAAAAAEAVRPLWQDALNGALKGSGAGQAKGKVVGLVREGNSLLASTRAPWPSARAIAQVMKAERMGIWAAFAPLFAEAEAEHNRFWARYSKYDLFHDALKQSVESAPEDGAYSPVRAVMDLIPERGVQKYDFLRALLQGMVSSPPEDSKYDVVWDILRQGRISGATAAPKYDPVYELLKDATLRNDWGASAKVESKWDPLPGARAGIAGLGDWGPAKYDPATSVFGAVGPDVRSKYDPFQFLVAATVPTASKYDMIADVLQAALDAEAAEKTRDEPFAALLNALQAVAPGQARPKFDVLGALLGAQAPTGESKYDVFPEVVRAVTESNAEPAAPKTDPLQSLLAFFRPKQIASKYDPVKEVKKAVVEQSPAASRPVVTPGKERDPFKALVNAARSVTTPPKPSNDFVAALLQAGPAKGEAKYDAFPELLRSIATPPARPPRDDFVAALLAANPPEANSKYDMVAALRQGEAAPTTSKDWTDSSLEWDEEDAAYAEALVENEAGIPAKKGFLSSVWDPIRNGFGNGNGNGNGKATNGGNGTPAAALADALPDAPPEPSKYDPVESLLQDAPSAPDIDSKFDPFYKEMHEKAVADAAAAAVAARREAQLTAQEAAENLAVDIADAVIEAAEQVDAEVADLEEAGADVGVSEEPEVIREDIAVLAAVVTEEAAPPAAAAQPLPSALADPKALVKADVGKTGPAAWDAWAFVRRQIAMPATPRQPSTPVPEASSPSSSPSSDEGRRGGGSGSSSRVVASSVVLEAIAMTGHGYDVVPDILRIRAVLGQPDTADLDPVEVISRRGGHSFQQLATSFRTMVEDEALARKYRPVFSLMAADHSSLLQRGGGAVAAGPAAAQKVAPLLEDLSASYQPVHTLLKGLEKEKVVPVLCAMNDLFRPGKASEASMA